MPRWETFSEVNRTVKSADGCPPIGVSFHEAKVTLIKRYHEFISYPEDSPRSDIAAVLPFRASRSVIPALKDIDIHQCREEGKQTIGIYPARLFFGQWAMPRFVMFTGDVPLLEDIRDLFMTWLTGSDMQEALPPVEKGIHGIFLRPIRYIAKSLLGNPASTSNGHHICQFVHHVLDGLGLCYNQLGEFEKGLSLYRKALGYSNRCSTCVPATIAYLTVDGRFTESTGLLQEMHEIIPETDSTGLSECLLTHSELFDAFTHWFSVVEAYHTSNTAYIVNAYTSATKVAFRQARTMQAAKSGTLQGRLSPDL
ncbi:hypothetical protein GB937_001326 [Aspergillus fischeri]|nr:hypothetical protein GB937_001326 [Aspergillus fischeri]